MEKQLVKGSEGIAEAAVRAGCRFFSGYPITPQNEVLEYFSRRLPEVGGVFIQAESEISAINMVYGASGAGFRAMTSSSSPGFSLKQEGLSYMAGAELPCVVANIMRAGPGLGGIQPGQADYFQATKGGGHGDYHVMVYAPSTVQESIDLTYQAFNKADEYRTPVLILADGMLAQMMEPATFPEMMTSLPKKSWATVGWTDKSRPRAVINSLFVQVDVLEALNNRLQEKYALMQARECLYESDIPDGAEILVVSYGSVARIVQSAIEQVSQNGLKVGTFRPISLYPFPYKQLEEEAAKVKAVVVVEMSAGQMVEDVRLALGKNKSIHFYGRTGGQVPTKEDLCRELAAVSPGVRG